MCKWLVFLVAGGALQAAIIKGSVVENQTGKALARTLVSVQPLHGGAGPTGTARTNTYGMLEFVDLPAGGYLIHAARRGFMTVQYGQKTWRAAGQPVVAETLRMSNNTGQLVPGRWQLMLAPSAAFVASDFRGPRGERPEGGRADGWNEITVERNCSVRIAVSDKPGGVHGTVTAGAHEPSGGVPVFLEAYDEVTHKRVIDLRSSRTDMRGQYNFVGLAPGTYRLVSTFEYQSPLTVDIDAMSPRVVKVEEGRDQQQDLDVYVIR